MELDLIDYLIEKNFDDEQIVRFQKKYLYKDDKDIIKKLNSIYKIFEYANLTEQEINKLISNNFELLGKSDIYIIKNDNNFFN